MNTFIEVQKIARETLPRLMDNLVFPNLIYRDIGESVPAKQGDTVIIRRPVELTAQDFDETEGTTTQDIHYGGEEVYLDHLATVDCSLNAWEATGGGMEALRRLFIEPAAAALADKINRDGLALYKDITQIAGTPGSTPDALEDLANAAYTLDVAKVPTDRRCAVWDPAANAKLKQIPAVVNAEKCGSARALRTGSIGSIFGMENYMSQAVPKHTAGTLAGMTVKVKYDATGTQNIYLTGTDIDGKTLVTGDLLKINGKYHTVRRNSTAESGEIEVGLYPGVTAEADTPVEIIGSHTANLVFHPFAFAFVTRPLAAPAGVESYVTTYNGISLRVVRGYDMRHKSEMLSMDVLYGFKTIHPNMAIRYFG